MENEVSLFRLNEFSVWIDTNSEKDNRWTQKLMNKKRIISFMNINLQYFLYLFIYNFVLYCSPNPIFAADVVLSISISIIALIALLLLTYVNFCVTVYRRILMSPFLMPSKWAVFLSLPWHAYCPPIDAFPNVCRHYSQNRIKLDKIGFSS